jgi:hypothetical protein
MEALRLYLVALALSEATVRIYLNGTPCIYTGPHDETMCTLILENAEGEGVDTSLIRLARPVVYAKGERVGDLMVSYPLENKSDWLEALWTMYGPYHAQVTDSHALIPVHPEELHKGQPFYYGSLLKRFICSGYMYARDPDEPNTPYPISRGIPCYLKLDVSYITK